MTLLPLLIKKQGSPQTQSLGTSQTRLSQALISGCEERLKHLLVSNHPSQGHRPLLSSCRAVEIKILVLMLLSANVQPSLCLFCQKNHALEDCHLLRWKPYQERIKFLASKRLCFGCLSDKHLARFCPERKACKFPNCTRKHPTVVHTLRNRDKCSVDVGVGTENSTEARVLNGMVNTDKFLNGLNQEARRRTAMAVIPVKVRSKENNKSVITYAFLDNGSSATFCAESLMKQLGVDGAKAKISLSTLEKKHSPVDSYLIRDLVVSDLDENNFVNLPILYTRPEIPVNVEDIPTQEDVDRWSYLHDLFILRC